MKALTEQLLETGYGDHVLTEEQLARLIGGSAARRYGLVNRALKSGEIYRLRRGLYVLADRYRNKNIHPFTLAQMLIPGSYVSFETALSHHNWIPEAVYTTTSVVSGRKSKSFRHEKYGNYKYYPLAIEKGYLLELVEYKKIDDQSMLIAKPIRALMDLVCLRKKEWQGVDWLLEGLRIEFATLQSVSKTDIGILKQVYKQNRVKNFLESLSKELKYD